MGNIMAGVQDCGQTVNLKRSLSVRSEADMVHDDVLLQELLELQEVELWRVHWCLSHKLLQDFPPIPSHWLESADACSTAKTMLKCYHEEGALIMLNAALTLIGQGCWVYHLQQKMKPPRPRLAPKPHPDFVKTQRRKLTKRIQSLDAILDTLQDHGILNAANRGAIDIYGVQKEKNRALVDLVLRKGDKAEYVFYKALGQSEPFLLQELDNNLFVNKNASQTLVVAEMVEFLLSKELKSFQWLISDHMVGESSRPIGGEQLHRADRTMMQKLLEKHFREKQVENVDMDILLKIVPAFSVCLRGEAVTSQKSPEIRVDMNMDTTVIEFTPEEYADGNMFRLRCQQPGVFHCRLTGLLLEGSGDVVYQMVPWDVDFLASKGLRPAGPLFRFTLLTGSFNRLHLPHCQLLSDGGQHFLSVAHVTADSMDLITPGQVTDSHVIIDVSGFSCFGLLTSALSASLASSEPLSTVIKGVVLLFHQRSDHSLFVLMLPRNVNLTMVIKEWKRRTNAEYLEVISDCELIPNQMYKLSGQPVNLIQPASSKFVNFSDYNNFLPSFHVQLQPDHRMVELKLNLVAPVSLIGWLFGSTESVAWEQVVLLRDGSSLSVCVTESADVTLLLLKTLGSIGKEDLKSFQHLLSLHSDPIPFSRLEAADRARTVDLMVQQYHDEVAKHLTVEILRKMKFNQLADELQIASI